MTTLALPELPDYQPRAMGLVSGAHRDQRSAALTLAANRASKISLLADAGHLDMAARFKADLDADVADFLARRRTTAQFRQALELAATPKPVAAPPSPLTSGQPVRMPNGLTGTVSHDFPRDNVRMAAVTVMRTSRPAHPRHGSRWPEQYHVAVDRLEPIAADQLEDHPAS